MPHVAEPTPAAAPSLPRRIVIVGNTGAGKSSLARALSRRLAIPHVELDAFMHEPGWVEAPAPVFRERVARALTGDAWVVDGNYGQARDLIWPRAEVIVWLDYALPRVLLQLFVRTVRRLVRREELWNGNRERFRDHFLSRRSLFLWAVQSHVRRRREYLAQMRQPAYAHVTFLRLRNPRATAAWLAGFCASAGHG